MKPLTPRESVDHMILGALLELLDAKHRKTGYSLVGSWVRNGGIGRIPPSLVKSDVHKRIQQYLGKGGE